MQKRKIMLLPIALILALTLSVVFILPASAKTTSSLRPAATCSGHGCDYLDPIATGCANGSEYTVYTANISGGRVELRWSPVCQTNWARVTSTIGATCLYGAVQRQSDGATASYSLCGTTSLYTDMLYSPGPARACGDVNNRGLGCTPFI